MSGEETLMRREIREIPDAVERLLSDGAAPIAETAARARALDPKALLSVGRGSSANVCVGLRYAAGLLLRRPMAPLGPSISSVYGVDLDAAGALCLAVSQSGRSPDIVAMTEALGRAGAMTVAVTNDPDAPLAAAASAVLPIRAGPERSVAATKTFVSSFAAGLALFAEIRRDAALLAALRGLPEALAAAAFCDWSEAEAALDGRALFTLGRGPSLAASDEAALKLKETCLIHAESHSCAEALHGPVSLIEPGFPVVVFAAGDAAEAGAAETADALSDKGARVFAVSHLVRRATALPHRRTAHPLTDPLAAIVSFYAMAERAARARGLDPDAPRHLAKVTKTL